jgi:hypothetical protein
MARLEKVEEHAKNNGADHQKYEKVDDYMGKHKHPLAKVRLTMFYNATDVKSKEKNLRAVITKWLRLLEN